MVRAAEEWGPDSVQPYQDILRSASIEQAMAIDAALERFPCGEPVLFFPYDADNWTLLTERGLVWCKKGEYGFARHEEIEAAETPRQLAARDEVSVRTRGGRTVSLKAKDGLVQMLQHARSRRTQRAW